MKILIFSPMLPNQREQMGLSKIVLDTIKHLHRRRHKISVISFCFSEEEQKLAEDLKQYCESVETVVLKAGTIKKWVGRLLAVFTRTPLFVSIFRSSEMRKKIISLTSHQHFDVIHIHGANIAQYVELFMEESATILYVHDVFVTRFFREYKAANSLLKKLYKFKNWKNVCRYEPYICEKFDTVITCSANNGDILRSRNPKINVSVVPFSIDDNYFDIVTKDSEEKSILFFGSFLHPPNVDSIIYFCEEIFPLIKAKVPDVTLSILGGSPPEKVQKLGNDKNIFVIGYAPEIEDYLARATVSVAPLRFGAGMKMKILVSLAAGKPVVTTPIGLESIDAVPGQDILVTHSAQEFAEKTVQVIKDPLLRKKLGENGRRLIREKYTWHTNILELEKISERLILHTKQKALAS